MRYQRGFLTNYGLSNNAASIWKPGSLPVSLFWLAHSVASYRLGVDYCCDALRTYHFLCKIFTLIRADLCSLGVDINF